ncbi:MAG: Dabb family protein [Desulfobacterales bacterium]
MLHHIVFFKFKPDTDENWIKALEGMLDNLPNVILEIQTFEFGRDVVRSDRSYDFALVSGFANLDAMKRYQVHPEHQKVLALVRAICEDVKAVDFESEYTSVEGQDPADAPKGFSSPPR